MPTRPQDSQSAPSAEPGRLAQYEVVRRLGAGGMAEVFLAKKGGAEGTYKLLVVKRILPTHGDSSRFRGMFVEEAQLATRLNHPNVVQVYEFQDGGDEGQLLAMEYVEGPDLGMLMSSAKARGTRISPWAAAWIIGEAAKGLHYAHEKRDEAGAPLEIVHRDVSPQNVLLSYEGSVKIADFGIASAKSFVEEAGVIKGKFGYMSPEQARGEKVDRRSDVYALAVIFWEMITGRPLHGGLGGEALLDIVRTGYCEPPSTFARDVPGELEAIIVKGLAPSRDDRFATARDLSSAVARALLVKQELVDATTLEAAIAQLVVRETPHETAEPPSAQESPPGDGQANRAERAAAKAGPKAGRNAESSVPPAGARAPVGPREVRHVAVVTLRLHGLDDLRALDPAQGQRTVERVRTLLGDLAYKRNAIAWAWAGDDEARTITGLTSNPARAAADCVGLAIDAQDFFASLNDDMVCPLSISIGIVRGIASGTRDPHGNLVRHRLHDPATYLADVVGKATPPNRTWVGGGVYRLVRKDFRWGDAPTLELAPPVGVESVPGTMRMYALERSLSREERLGEALGAPSDLVGRDAERADLGAAYHEAAGGTGAVVYRAVVGELGIGKSALVSAFVSELPPNARLIRAECSPVRMEVPLSTVAELVRDAIGTTGEEPFEQVASLIARAGGGTAQGDASNPLVARLAELATNRLAGGSGDDDDASVRKKVLQSGVRSLLGAIALQQPLVVIVEGLQWADKASLDLLGELMRRDDPLPILVVFVTRLEDRVAPLLDGIVRIELNGLSSDEQVRLVEGRLGVHAGVREVCADLMPRVAGNPFFLLEMVDALLERGTLEIREVGDGDARSSVLVHAKKDGLAGLPSTLEQLLEDRIRELPTGEHLIVEWLAVAGGPLATDDLRALAPSTYEEAVMRLCARGLCDDKGGLLDFRHPLTRDVAYRALAAQDRVQMHHALGEHLSRSSLARGLSAAIVGRHFARGDDGERAAEFYAEAGSAARSSNQTALAIRYKKRALALLADDAPQRIGLHDALETLYRTLGRRSERMHHLGELRLAAREVGTPRAACIGLMRTGRFHLDEGRLVKGLPVAKQAAALGRSANVPALEIEAEALISEFLRELGDAPGALAACDRALAASNPNVNPSVPSRTRADVLRARGVLLRRVGRVREAVDSQIEAIAVFRATGARRQEARAKNSLAFALLVQGHYEDAIALLIEAIQIDLSVGGRFQLANTLTNIGHAYARIGDLPRAQAYLARARQTHERYDDQDNRADTLVVSAELMIEERRLDEAENFLRDAAALNAVTANAYSTVHEGVVRAALAHVRRDAKTAVAAALSARRAAEDQSLVSFHFYGLALEAAARVDTGETHTATLLATTALGVVESLQGCEYGLEIRALCADTLKRAGAPEAKPARQRAIDYAQTLVLGIRDARNKQLFAAKPIVAALFDTTPAPAAPPAATSAPKLESASK